MNVQVACILYGILAWISDPIAGSRHDSHCLGESGVLLTLDPGNWIGDKGYVKQVNKIRYVIERAIANFKTWRIMHTDYRRPLATFATTVSAVIDLHFYATS